MMDLVGSSYGPCIAVVRIPEHFEPLMDEDIMHHKIGNPVGQNAKSERPAVPEFRIGAEIEQYHTYHSIEYEEGIVPFEPGVVILAMMVSVQAP